MQSLRVINFKCGFLVNGGYTPWSDYSQCNARCGTVGYKVRTRTCTNPVPSNHGRPCQGLSEERKPCYGLPCKGNLFIDDLLEVHEDLFINLASLSKQKP